MKSKRSKRQNTSGGEAPARRQISISTRLFLSIMILVLLFVFAVVFLETRLTSTLSYISTLWRMWDLDQVFEQIYSDDGADYPSRFTEVERQYGVIIEVDDETGVMVYSSASADDVYGPQTDQSLRKNFRLVSTGFDLLQASEKYFEIRADDSSGYNPEYVVLIMDLDNGYTVRAYKMKTPMDEGAQVAIQVVVYSAFGVIILAAVILRIFSNRFTKPLKNISETTQAMSKLDFTKRCPPSRTKEISVLSDSINELSESLNNALEDLKTKNLKLQEEYEREVKLEHLRADFIAGASHELKTPIAIIRGYAEGMTYFVDSDPETAKQYLSTIVGETERMNGLVMKLLEILKYDSGDYALNEDDFDIGELVQDWFTRNTEVLADKGITYENEIPAGLIGRGDSLLLSSVVNNYLSNAVSHIDGERVLRAWADESDGRCRVSIFNTGKQIADKDIENIWGSFYRADKSMSRAEGRFGLGLTIVASIQKLHGMDFGVENMPDGVRFWFDVRRAEGSEEGIHQE